MVISQQLKPTDHEQRLNFARQMKTIFEANDNLTLLMSDEAHFHLNGMVNKQNFRYWATENPREIYKRPLHSPKVTVWCAMGKTAIIGPYFFEDNHGNAVTVNSERYIEMINSFFVPALRRRHITIQHVWFQQDGATAHTARASMAVLRPLFKDHLISRFADTPLPPRSPDLSMCDYFLWGHLKACVYVHHCKKSWVFFALKNWVFFTPKNWAKFLGILVWTPKHGISEITKANYIWYMLKLPNSLNVGKVIFTRIYTRWSSQIYLS